MNGGGVKEYVNATARASLRFKRGGRRRIPRLMTERDPKGKPTAASKHSLSLLFVASGLISKPQGPGGG